MKTFLRIAFALVLFVSAARADEFVAKVQGKLARQGFYHGVVDGNMGSQTSAAIRRFQIANGLNVTGRLDPQTLTHLGLSTEAAKPAVPEYVAIADIFKGGPYISIGPEAQISTIRQAQKNLKTLGYYSGPINGSPSPELVSALKAFQKSAGFRQTGRFDETTLKGLSLMEG